MIVIDTQEIIVILVFLIVIAFVAWAYYPPIYLTVGEKIESISRQHSTTTQVPVTIPQKTPLKPPRDEELSAPMPPDEDVKPPDEVVEEESGGIVYPPCEVDPESPFCEPQEGPYEGLDEMSYPPCGVDTTSPLCYSRV
jgi:hypothetical protein